MKKVKHRAVLTVVFSVLAVLSALLLVFGGINSKNVRFLHDFDIEVKPYPVDTATVKIPKPFDSVYESYNALQLSAGFDLMPYAGETVRRYTYAVTSFYADGETVYANVLCDGGRQIGGDVMTRSLSGFMMPLDFMLDKSR